MLIQITADYLWLPVKKDAPMVTLHFFHQKEKFQEIDIRLAEGTPDFYTAMDVRRYADRWIEVLSGEPETGADTILKNAAITENADKPDPPADPAPPMRPKMAVATDAALKQLCCRPDVPSSDYPYRPLLHFTPEIGWTNDPNGLVYANGLYHLYHQWNPYGTDWGNMHWGHAVSRDLVHWEHRPMALAPDVYGTVFSGCAISDEKNAAGFGADALLYFYTAAGGTNEWSADAKNPFTQRLAVSADGGETLEKKGLILDHIKAGNRDPKVFYHPESRAYIMVLYLDASEFALFRSDDLLHWTMTQQFSAEPMMECPDLFRLRVEPDPADGDAVTENGGADPAEHKWVFWSADGYYIVGSFDGYRFTPESEVQSAYDTPVPYAAQTWSGIRDRTISIAWCRLRKAQGPFHCMLSVPMTLSLRRPGGGYRICLRPVEEILSQFTISQTLTAGQDGLSLPLPGAPVRIDLEPESTADIHILAGETNLCLKCAGRRAALIIDHGLIEYFCDDGLVYGAVEAEEDILSKTLQIGSGAGQILMYQMGDGCVL